MSKTLGQRRLRRLAGGRVGREASRYQRRPGMGRGKVGDVVATDWRRGLPGRILVDFVPRPVAPGLLAPSLHAPSSNAARQRSGLRQQHHAVEALG